MLKESNKNHNIVNIDRPLKIKITKEHYLSSHLFPFTSFTPITPIYPNHPNLPQLPLFTPFTQFLQNSSNYPNYFIYLIYPRGVEQQVTSELVTSILVTPGLVTAKSLIQKVLPFWGENQEKLGSSKKMK